MPQPNGHPSPSFLLRESDQLPPLLTRIIDLYSASLLRLADVRQVCWQLKQALEEKGQKQVLKPKEQGGRQQQGEGSMDLMFRVGKPEFRAHGLHIKQVERASQAACAL